MLNFFADFLMTVLLNSDICLTMHIKVSIFQAFQLHLIINWKYALIALSSDVTIKLCTHKWQIIKLKSVNGYLAQQSTDCNSYNSILIHKLDSPKNTHTGIY